MRWSEAVTLQFVKIYLKHECLWSPAHPGYKIRSQREKAYTDICSKFKLATNKTLSILEVKMKIKNLRTTYVQQVHKILLKSSPDDIYEPSLVWFHEMDRCLKHIIPCNRHSNSYNNSQESQEVDSSSQIWVEEDQQNAGKDMINSDPLIPQTDDDYESNKNKTQIKVEEKSSPLSYRKLKKKKQKHRAPISYSTDSEYAKEDEFDIYGKYIATHLRKMDLIKALRLQLEIQHLISKSRISEIVSSD